MVKNKKKPNEKRRGNHGKFNIKEIKKKINEELYSKKRREDSNKSKNLYSPVFISNNTFEDKEDREKEYYDKYTIYMAEQFNSTLVNMIILYINKDKKLPVKYQKELNFINTFIELVKSLLMNSFTSPVYLYIDCGSGKSMIVAFRRSQLAERKKRGDNSSLILNFTDYLFS